MADLNRVFLIGRLTQDPELRYTPNGAPVTDLRIATSRAYTTKDGDRREDTLYIDVTTWNRQAENCCQYLRKGSQIHVEGYLKMETWEDRNSGEKRSKVKVEAERVQFLDSRRDAGAEPGRDGGFEDSPPPPRRSMPEAEFRPAGGGQPAPRGGVNTPAGTAPRRPAPPPQDEDNEDIPF